MNLSEDQNQAADAILAGENVFLTGEAGTGKSTVINYVRPKIDNMVMLAPTGLAALNVGGSTIHRFLGLKIGVQEPDSYVCSSRHKESIQAADVIGIDEVSMVRIDLFSIIDEALRKACDSTEPFAGKQIVCIGDFFQLPPIVREPRQYEDNTFNERVWLDENFGENATYAFESKAWKAANFSFQNLTTVHRQDDKRFINALNKIRRGDTSGLSYINKKAKKEAIKNAVVLTSTNDKAEAANTLAMRNLTTYKTTAFKCNAIVKGEFPESEYPMPSALELCEKARVIFTSNDNESPVPRYVNGDTGTVIKRNEPGVDVRKDNNGEIVTVFKYKWEREAYRVVKDERGKKKLLKYVVGTFEQLPLKPAWAITAHKSQGQTLDKAHVNMPTTFANGQLYVALSRCKSIDNLSLQTKLLPSALKTSEKVIKFYDRRGGVRNGAGRKASKWPVGTKLKVMRMPANIESEITEFAIKLLNQKNVKG